MSAEFNALDELAGRRCVQRRAIKDPRTVGQRVLGLDLAARNRLAQRAGADIEERCGLCLVHPALSDTAILVETANLVVTAERGDSLA